MSAVYLVFEAGNGYGESFNAFKTKVKAKEFFLQLVKEYEDFTELSPKEQKEVLDSEEFRCDDNVMKIIPLLVV